MRYIATLLLGMITLSCHSAIVLYSDTQDQPEEIFRALVLYQDFNDPMPNPCYQIVGCKLIAFAMDEKSMPSGDVRAPALDNGFTGSVEHWVPRTLGEWNSTRTEAHDLWYQHPPWVTAPCVAIAATMGNTMILGTVVSNCTNPRVQARSCSVLPAQIEVNMSGPPGQIGIGVPQYPVTVSCISDSNVRIETTTGGIVVLQGATSATAALDFGAGFQRPGVFNVKKNQPVIVPLRVKVQGTEDATPGVLSGSGSISVSYQ